MNIYVSNIPYQTSEDDLRQAFGAYGTVSSARIIKDRQTGKSRGFGFVEMDSDDDARKALEGMNGGELLGRKINAREARPREEGGGNGGGDNGGGQGGHSGGNGGGGNRGYDRGPRENSNPVRSNRGNY